MSLHSKESLHERLRNRKFRDAFVSSRIAQTIATQVRVLRQRNEMSQKELARSLGTSQNAVYRLENPKYGRPNISTLKKIASFFEVGLIVRFAPLSEIADWTINLSEKSMDVPDFEHDTDFIEHKPQGTASVGFAREAQPLLESAQDESNLPGMPSSQPRQGWYAGLAG